MNKNIFLLSFILTLFAFIPFNVNAMQIFIQPPEGENIILEVESSDTIEAVKRKIEEQEKISSKYQKLIYNEKELEEGRTLADYTIEKESIIKLLYTLTSEISINSRNAKVKYKDSFVDKIEIAPGTSKIISIIPEENYKIESILIDNGEIIKNEDGTYTINNVIEENVTLNIIAIEENAIAKKIVDNDIIWLESNILGQEVMFGLDNTNNLFEKDSLFWIKIIEKTTEEYEYYHKQIDDEVLIENDIMFLVGVKNKDGSDYKTINELTKLYVQYLDIWENKNIETIYINQNKDEKIELSVIEKENPFGKNNFVELNLRHFSPYIIYNEKIVEESVNVDNPETFDSVINSIIVGTISLILLMGITNYFRNKIRA